MSVGIFTWLLQYFSKNRAILVQKLWGEKSYQNPFSAKYKKKVPMAIKLEREGGKALIAWPLVEESFFAASLRGTAFKKRAFLRLPLMF